MTSPNTVEKHYYGGLLGRNLATVEIKTSYSPKQFNSAREEIFQTRTLEISGLLETKTISLRRGGEQGRVPDVDAAFTTLYELTKPYPTSITIDGRIYKVVEVTPKFGAQEDRFVWYLVSR